MNYLKHHSAQLTRFWRSWPTMMPICLPFFSPEKLNRKMGTLERCRISKLNRRDEPLLENFLKIFYSINELCEDTVRNGLVGAWEVNMTVSPLVGKFVVINMIGIFFRK
jgi:hypothetical protein